MKPSIEWVHRIRAVHAWIAYLSSVIVAQRTVGRTLLSGFAKRTAPLAQIRDFSKARCFSPWADDGNSARPGEGFALPDRSVRPTETIEYLPVCNAIVNRSSV